MTTLQDGFRPVFIPINLPPSRFIPVVHQLVEKKSRNALVPLLFFVSFLLCGLTSTQSFAYVVYKSQNGKPVRWAKMPIRWQYNHNGFTKIASAQILQTITQAFQVWQQPTCATLNFAYDGVTKDRWNTQDNKNTILWNNKIPDPQFETALALTLLFYSRDGQMLDADIVLNSTYPWSLNPKSGEFDLKGAVAHEIGHLLGLDHTPDRGAAMYARARPGSCPCRTLQQDDVNGLCFLYPNASKGSQKVGERCDATSLCVAPLLCAPLVAGAKEGRCLNVCTGTACSSGEPCVTLEGGQKACQCNKNEDCSNRRTCVNFQCNGPLIKRELGEACAKDDPCKDGLACIYPEGTQKGFCVHACPTGSCPGLETCKTLKSGTKACFCEAQDECKDGSFCINYQCKEDDRISYDGKLGERCDSLRRCLKTLSCQKFDDKQREGWCVKPCDTKSCDSSEKCQTTSNGKFCFCEKNGDCSSGEVCRDFHCRVSGGGEGDACGRGLDCKSPLVCQKNPSTDPNAPDRICRKVSSSSETCVSAECLEELPLADAGRERVADAADKSPDGASSKEDIPEKRGGCGCSTGEEEGFVFWGLVVLCLGLGGFRRRR